jgi:hypothetical protein
MSLSRPAAALLEARPTGRLGQGRGQRAPERQGTQGLGGPSVAITGMGYRYSANADIDLDPARRALGGVLGRLPPWWGRPFPLPQLPPALQRKSTNASASLSLSGRCTWAAWAMRCAAAWTLPPMKPWPMPPAAATPCILLVQRYFGAQLAERGPPAARARVRWRACAPMTRPRSACSRPA